MTSAEREAEILSLESRVRFLTNQRYRQLRNVAYEEILSAAWLGAIQAVDSRDPERGTLSTYADWKIRSAIGDYLRSLDPLTRAHRQLIRSGELTPPRHKRLQFENEDGSMTFSIPDPRSSREREKIDARLDTERLLRRAALSDKEVTVITGTMRDVTMKRIGAELGVCESRISQRYHRALEKLRAAA